MLDKKGNEMLGLESVPKAPMVVLWDGCGDVEAG
ncbi:MAG: hypothetical protein N838_14425 [Thiohalocapsa sp. PB-PSB1]|nr:MAG: hypothetical protein N838_14425 [Thiohalocapsa sp. PB-PSB1]